MVDRIVLNSTSFLPLMHLFPIILIPYVGFIYFSVKSYPQMFYY